MRFVLACLFLFVGCSGGSDNPSDIGAGDARSGDFGITDTISDVVTQEDAKPASIVGDWFICEDQACTKPTYKGFRFGTDNFYRELFAVPPYLEPNEQYCHITSSEFVLQYKLEGDTLVLIVPGSAGKLTYKIDKLTTEMMVLEGDSYRRVDPPRSSGPCGGNDPWICPTVSTIGDSKLCSWIWQCDNGKFRLSCIHIQEHDYKCECNENGQKISTFTAKDVCLDSSANGPIDLANTNCNWKIWKP